MQRTATAPAISDYLQWADEISLAFAEEAEERCAVLARLINEAVWDAQQRPSKPRALSNGSAVAPVDRVTAHPVQCGPSRRRGTRAASPACLPVRRARAGGSMVICSLCGAASILVARALERLPPYIENQLIKDEA